MSLLGLITGGVKLVLFGILLVAIQFFLNFLLGLIPPLNLIGCMGYYASAFGIKQGIDLLLSIVVYGFSARFAISFFKTYLN